MASGTVQSTTLPPPPPAPLESRERERIIRRQLARTGLQVRLVDLASSLAIWVIGVVVLFLLMALVDHVFGLGRVGRCAALAVLLGGSLWYLVMQVGPLLVRTINPAYAARTIEETRPTLKNSLINFLLLRNDKSGLKEIVYQAVEQQAAVDIATVNVESTVDRSRLIYVGYVLCGVMGLLAAYKILSPKDPFQTVARVLAPWADIARPSRVQISDVQPGSAEVYHGQTVRISATIRGARDGERIAVLYSTADGQTIDQPIAMKLSAGDRYECDLPAESGGSAAAGGLLQNATYHIVAGDAESFPYRLTVISAPTIVVDRLDLAFPGYTKKAADSLAQQGDIKALEGTKVSIHAVANQPIKSVWIEFDPAANEAAAETAPLNADGERARGTITLQLKPDRQTPWHATYQVRFYNERGQRSQQPILHRIEVIRDLAPEVQILRPERLRMEVPEDGEQTIEVRAVDPDFGIASLRIEGAANGKPPVSIDLLSGATNQPPQITVPLAFRPREHNLKAGDEFHYVAVADDNRTNPQTGQPDPNSTRSKEYTLVITAPKNSGGGQGGQGGNDQKQAQGGKNQNQPQAGQQKADQKSKQDPKNQEQPQPMNDDGQKNQDKSDKQQQSDNKEQQKEGQKGDQKNGGDSKQQGDQKQGNQQSGDRKSGDQQKSDQQNQSQPSGQQQSGEQQSGDQKSGQKQDSQQKGGQSGDAQQNNQSGGGGQKGQSASKGGNDAREQADPSGGGQASDSATGQGGKSGQPSSASQKGGGQQGDKQGEPAGDQGKAQHDGQAIERIWKEMQKRGESKPQDGQSRDGQAQDGAGKPQGGEKGSGEQNQSLQDQKASDDKSQQPGNEPGGQPQTAGSSGAPGKSNPNSGTPEGNDQKLKAKDEDQAGKGKSEKTGDRLPEEQQGQNPSQQQSGGSKGGESHGGSKTDKGEKSDPSQGQHRDSGAGKTGDEGAGQAGEGKSGSGDGNFKNRDRDKEQKPDGSKEQKNEPSPANSSNRQSDSKGGSSGDRSGGGKQGAGQSAGQEGNDSAGSKSAGDQGTGKAQETGGGETGSKAGEQQKAAGKTGKSGDEAGEGSGSRGGNDPGAAGAKADKQPQGDEGENSQKKSDSDRRAKGGERGSDPVGGKDDNQERFQNKTEAGESQEADAANLEYARKATEMVLKRLKDEEHNPDPELLDKLGWSREDLAEFLRRWDALQKSANESPTGRRELDDALQSLGLRDPTSKKRAGGKTSDSQRDLRDAGNRSAPPPRYRDMFDAFRKGSARSTP